MVVLIAIMNYQHPRFLQLDTAPYGKWFDIMINKLGYNLLNYNYLDVGDKDTHTLSIMSYQHPECKYYLGNKSSTL